MKESQVTQTVRGVVEKAASLTEHATRAAFKLAKTAGEREKNTLKGFISRRKGVLKKKEESD
jgi:hypothetical protein